MIFDDTNKRKQKKKITSKHIGTENIDQYKSATTNNNVNYKKNSNFDVENQSLISETKETTKDSYFLNLDCDDPADASKLSYLNWHLGKLKTKHHKKEFFKNRIYFLFVLQAIFFFGVWFLDNFFHTLPHGILLWWSIFSVVLIPILISLLNTLRKAVGLNIAIMMLINLSLIPFFLFFTRFIGMIFVEIDIFFCVFNHFYNRNFTLSTNVYELHNYNDYFVVY